jgi:hypothetical protein
MNVYNTLDVGHYVLIGCNVKNSKKAGWTQKGLILRFKYFYLAAGEAFGGCSATGWSLENPTSFFPTGLESSGVLLIGD